jgi:hypothetical protein
MSGRSRPGGLDQAVGHGLREEQRSEPSTPATNPSFPGGGDGPPSAHGSGATAPAVGPARSGPATGRATSRHACARPRGRGRGRATSRRLTSRHPGPPCCRRRNLRRASRPSPTCGRGRRRGPSHPSRSLLIPHLVLHQQERGHGPMRQARSSSRAVSNRTVRTRLGSRSGIPRGRRIRAATAIEPRQAGNDSPCNADHPPARFDPRRTHRDCREGYREREGCHSDRATHAAHRRQAHRCLSRRSVLVVQLEGPPLPMAAHHMGFRRGRQGRAQRDGPAGLSAGDDPSRAGTPNFYSFTRGGFVTGTITSGGRRPPETPMQVSGATRRRPET